jgi:hypothetical protein
MSRNRIPRLFFEPFPENLRRLIDLTQRTVRQCKQLARFGGFGRSVIALQ